jgi:hypothetical protein
MVIGMHESAMIRRMFEDRISLSFQEGGVQAVPSLEMIPPEKAIDKDAVKAVIEGSDFDAVLITRLIGKETELELVRGGTYVVPRGYYSHMYGYYTSAYDVVHQPNYLVENTVLRLETNIYDVASEELLWSALSETLNPDSAIDATESLGREVLKGLASRGLIQ